MPGKRTNSAVLFSGCAVKQTMKDEEVSTVYYNNFHEMSAIYSTTNNETFCFYQYRCLINSLYCGSLDKRITLLQSKTLI
jgi:hypothetical protein